MAKHECPYPECTRQVAASMLACRAHWFTVSKATRDWVWAAYNGAGDDHYDAITQAMREMQEHYDRRQAGQ